MKTEFYDKAGYKEKPTDNEESWYHPLSQSHWPDDNTTNQDNNKDDIAYGTLPTFVYAHIKAPHEKQDYDNNFTQNDFRFQCYNEVGSVESKPVPIDRVLYIRNFGISTELISGN